MYKESTVFAENLAKKLAVNPHLEEQIIDKIALQIDGDTEILLEHLDRELSHLIPQSNLNLELRMPMAKLWSINSIRKAGGLRVFVYEFGKSSRKIEALNGFDGAGNKVSLNKKNAKDFPYIIVAASDRVKDNKYTYGDAKSFKTQDIRFAYYPHKKSEIDKETKIDKLLKKDDNGKRLDGSGIDVIFPSVPTHDDEDYWGYHLCLANNQPFCGIRFECSYTPPPPPAAINETEKYQYLNKYPLKNSSNSRGLIFNKIKFDDGFDYDWGGWFDGELEIGFEMKQVLLNLNIPFSVTIGPITIPGGINISFNENTLLGDIEQEFTIDEDGEEKFYNSKFYFASDFAVTPIPLIQSWYMYNYTVRFKMVEYDALDEDEYFNSTISNIENWLAEHCDTNIGSAATLDRAPGIHVIMNKLNW